MTDIEPKKQGPVVYLPVPDKIRKSCNDVSVQDLNKDNELNVLVNKIKSLHTKDMNALAFMAYDKFNNFRRSDDTNIIDYINEFERLNNQIKHFEMKLPTGALAYKVLKNANLSKEKHQLIRATIVSLTYENMKKQLKAIFESSTCSQSSEDIDIKSESVFYTNRTNDSESYKDNTNHYPKNGHKYRKFPSVGRCNNRQKQNSREDYDQWGQKTNPLDKSGNISCCAICQSIYHWANDCPNNVKQEQSSHVKITLFTQDIHKCYIEKFVDGMTWLDSYLNTLTEKDAQKVLEESSSSSFRSGDGNSKIANKFVTIPARIRNEDIM